MSEPRGANTNPVQLASVVTASLVWCYVAGWSSGTWQIQRSILLLATFGFGVACGIFSGFLFSSSGKEEEATFGKIRDWLIAGISGAGAAEIMERGGSVKRLLVLFSIGSAPTDLALVITTFVLGFAAGFFFMFLQRELSLNEQLAKARAQTANAEKVQYASTVVHELLIKLPVDMLTGCSDVTEAGLSPAERKELKDLLESKEITEFLNLTEDRAKSGGAVIWDSLSKAAYIQYYKTYFVESSERDAQIRSAEEWILRALMVIPYHPGLTIALSDLKALKKNFSSAAHLLRDLVELGDPPASAIQLLGYYLIGAGDDQDSLRFTEMYLELHPQDSVTLFNAAYSYGRLYCAHPDKANLKTTCYRRLKDALSIDPAHVEKILNVWIAKENWGTCFKDEETFKQMMDAALAGTQALRAPLPEVPALTAGESPTTPVEAVTVAQPNGVKPS